MASGSPAGPGRAQGRAALQTGDTQTRHQRFSWQDTPLEVQRSTFQQFSSPTNPTIDESPISPPDGYQNFHAHHQRLAVPGHTAVQAPVERTSSPYGLPPPTETHPAYFAPVVEQTQLPQSELRQPIATDLKDTPEDLNPSRNTPTPKPISHPQKESALVLKPDSDGSIPVYSPKSLAGPNAASDNHRPGQVAHPNAAVEPEWKHGLCEVDTLCCIGLCCPCILYGRTQYRITRKTQKEDPTNLLGYESCNASDDSPLRVLKVHGLSSSPAVAHLDKSAWGRKCGRREQSSHSIFQSTLHTKDEPAATFGISLTNVVQYITIRLEAQGDERKA
ncbi:MAG: hypothetical protein Q9210_003777 [Variospora velana]